MALPKVSAVMPVPSETKNTVRWAMSAKNIKAAGMGAAPTMKTIIHRPVHRPLEQSKSAAAGLEAGF
jgi:hypothetical protein